jgi:hypothetical protein
MAKYKIVKQDSNPFDKIEADSFAASGPIFTGTKPVKPKPTTGTIASGITKGKPVSTGSRFNLPGGNPTSGPIFHPNWGSGGITTSPVLGGGMIPTLFSPTPFNIGTLPNTTGQTPAGTCGGLDANGVTIQCDANGNPLPAGSGGGGGSGSPDTSGSGDGSTGGQSCGMDNNGNPIPCDANGNPTTDVNGNPLDANGNPINSTGQMVDANGNPIDANGNPIAPAPATTAPVVKAATVPTTASCTKDYILFSLLGATAGYFITKHFKKSKWIGIGGGAVAGLALSWLYCKKYHTATASVPPTPTATPSATPVAQTAPDSSNNLDNISDTASGADGKITMFKQPVKVKVVKEPKVIHRYPANDQRIFA